MAILLLDVMGTLCYEPFHRELPAFFGMSLERLIAEKHPTAWAEFERSEIDARELAARFFRDGRAVDLAALEACMRESYRFLDGIEELLRELRARGHEMHALSNYPVWYRWIEERLALSRFLSWSFVSCDTGVRKPDPRAYDGAARALGVAPAACLFVDDREENCAGARAAGMDAVRFEGAEALTTELAARGLLDGPARRS